MSTQALWIREREVVDLVSLPDAIEALADGFQRLHGGDALNMSKTQVTWGNGHTLHALGAAIPGQGIIGAKVWAHTEGGATPLLALWHEESGQLAAIVEAFAMGQMRTAAVTGLATRHMASPQADTLAIIGSGKQALPQVAAIAAVRPLREVRVYSPTAAHRATFVADLRTQLPFTIRECESAAEAARDASIVTLATRARSAFFHADMAAAGAHINAMGAIGPEREEFSQGLFARAGWLATDDPSAAMGLSREFSTWFGGLGHTEGPQPLSAVVARGLSRPPGCDLSIFKAMGMGLSDVALGQLILTRALARGAGMPIPQPQKANPRLNPLNIQQSS
jgi:ornithine cyclodeaminase